MFELKIFLEKFRNIIHPSLLGGAVINKCVEEVIAVFVSSLLKKKNIITVLIV